MTQSSTQRKGSADNDLTILMTGAGAPGASGIIRSLRSVEERNIRIVGVDMDPAAYGFGLVDAYDTVPAGTDDDYVSRIAKIAKEADVDVVLPLTTDELRPLAANRDAIPAPVMVSNLDAIDIANDKGALYGFLESNGFDSAPEFRTVSDRDGFIEAVESLGYPDVPVCFKPPVASGMRGFRILDERTDRLTRLLDEKPGEAVTTLDEVLPVLSDAESFPELVVMEYLPGEEYSVDVLAMGDSVGPVIPRTRAKTRAGISFQGVVEENDQLIEEAAEICRELGVEFNINLQFKYDDAGIPKMIEINPRVSGTIIMCVGAGVNLPYLGVKYALNESVPSVEPAWGTRMARYWNEIFWSTDGETYHIEPEEERVPNRSA